MKKEFKYTDFIVEIDKKWYTAQEFRVIVAYENILSGRELEETVLLDTLVYDRWNMVMPMTKRARLLMDDGTGVIKECGRFKYKVNFSSREDVGADGWCADPRNSKGKY
jgi:hypothetical protein